MKYEKVDVTGYPSFDGHEKVFFVENEACGLKAFIGIHSTRLGPALGGCRMYNYRSEDQAVRDTLLLARGMTYKNALAGLPLGGGHVVIIGNPGVNKSDAMFRCMGRAIDCLGGEIIVGGDSGINSHDLGVMGEETGHVVGLPVHETWGPIGGDFAPYAAYGVYCGMKRAAQRRLGVESLSGVRVAMQGVGAVGFELCRLLHNEGAILVACELDPQAIRRAKEAFPDILFIDSSDIFSVEAEIFSPCAMGAQLNSNSIPQMHFDIIAGSANNQLHHFQHDQWLADRDILYVPDTVINAGATIAAAYEHFQRAPENPLGHELTRETLRRHVEGIANTVDEVLDFAEEYGLPSGEAANSVAERVFLGGCMLTINATKPASSAPVPGEKSSA
ncbi:MAG: Glu/Leu/Phe/Val dehydrogenase [Alphaproteobacteria bacterium]|nr:Glu/Leu/Phe/Val dehydrogenase [Alphaproteobacteria bacterium]